MNHIWIFFAKKAHWKWQKKSIFGTIGNHTLGFCAQCKKSQLFRSSHLQNRLFLMTPYHRWVLVLLSFFFFLANIPFFKVFTKSFILLHHSVGQFVGNSFGFLALSEQFSNHCLCKMLLWTQACFILRLTVFVWGVTYYWTISFSWADGLTLTASLI